MNINHPKPENKTASKKDGPGSGKKDKRPPKKITQSYLHNAGLYYLQRFAASSNHFRSVMLRKVKKSCLHHKDQDYDECAAMVDALTAKFIETGLLNDEVYTRGAVTSLRRQGKSKRAILDKMRTKGVQHNLTEKNLKDVDSNNTPEGMDPELFAALIFARRKKIGPYSRDQDTPQEKMLGRMARAGFSYEISQKVLAMSAEDLCSITGL